MESHLINDKKQKKRIKRNFKRSVKDVMENIIKIITNIIKFGDTELKSSIEKLLIKISIIESIIILIFSTITIMVLLKIITIKILTILFITSFIILLITYYLSKKLNIILKLIIIKNTKLNESMELIKKKIEKY